MTREPSSSIVADARTIPRSSPPAGGHVSPVTHGSRRPRGGALMRHPLSVTAPTACLTNDICVSGARQDQPLIRAAYDLHPARPRHCARASSRPPCRYALRRTRLSSSNMQKSDRYGAPDRVVRVLSGDREIRVAVQSGVIVDPVSRCSCACSASAVTRGTYRHLRTPRAAISPPACREFFGLAVERAAASAGCSRHSAMVALAPG